MERLLAALFSIKGLSAIIFLWTSITFGYIYLVQVSLPSIEERRVLVASVVRGQEKADYLYAMFTVATIQQWLIDHVGRPGRWFALVDLAGIVFLFACAYFFLIQQFPNPYSIGTGLLWLSITMPLFFRDHFYHPTDFYGVGLMFLMLLAAKAERQYLLAVLLFLSGAIWEKALFVPLIFAIYITVKYGFKRGLLLAVTPTMATLFWFIAWRVKFPDAPRVLLLTWPEFIERLPRDAFKWTLWLSPLTIPAADLTIHHRQKDWFWLLWLLYIPILVVTLIALTHYWGELRTFWILQPIIIGFLVSWASCFWREKADGGFVRDTCKK